MMFKNIVYQVVSMWLPSVALHIFPFISITLLTMALCSFKRKCVKARKEILNLGNLGAIFATELVKSSLSCGSIDFQVFEWCPWFVCLLDINFHEIVHFVVVSTADLWMLIDVLHPNISIFSILFSIHILVCCWGEFLTIKTFFNWWLFPLFLLL